jgi:hypothetical protein
MKIPPLAPQFATSPGALAAKRLFEFCRWEEPETELVAEFLACLHDSTFTPVDIFLLSRNINDACFEDVMTVLRWFRDLPGRRELRTIFGEQGKAVMTDLINRYGFETLRPFRRG